MSENTAYRLWLGVMFILIVYTLYMFRNNPEIFKALAPPMK